MKIVFTIALIIALTSFGIAQTCNIKLTGHIEDIETKENLVAATVTLKETGAKIEINVKGDFLFSGLCQGNYTLIINHVSYTKIEKLILLKKDYHVDILMKPIQNSLSQVIVEGQKILANTGFKKELTGRVLEETKGFSLAETLSKINGVTMLQTGSTISKPVIHGLHSNRILTINNGVRQEGQQWGNEHAPEIDPFIAEKLLVIKGVDELRYGSDAVGGVILVEPRPLRKIPGYQAELNTAYFTNNRQYVVSGVFEQQLKKQPAFSYRIQGTYKKAANVTTPNYRLNNTGSEENNYSITLGWNKEKINTEIFYSHFSTKLGIFTGSHIGNVTDLQNAIAAQKPNDVFLGQDSYEIQRPYQKVVHDLLKWKTSLYSGENKFTLLVAGQFNQRKEYDVVRNSNNQNPQLDLSIYTITEDLSWEHPKKNNFRGTAGISMMQQNNSYNGRYFIPNYFAYSFGGYFIEKWSKHKWEIQAGVRIDHKNIETTRLKTNNDSVIYKFVFTTVASSFNVVFKPTSNIQINSNLSISNRAPYVNELLSDGIHHGTATYEKGDLSLKPEQSTNINAGINYQNKSKSFSVALLLYFNNIKDFIYQQPIPDSPVLSIAGAFPLLKYQQTDAQLSGLDISTSFKPFSNFEWISKFSYLVAKNKKIDDWLIRMPANRINNEFVINLKNSKRLINTYISSEILNVMEQNNVPSDLNGKQDYKEPPPSYTLINLNFSTTLSITNKPITISIGIRNMLNTAYRDYLNSMRYFTDEIGRNIGIKLKFQL